MFYVTEFDDGSVDVVPENWMQDNGQWCYWPLSRGKQTLEAIINQKMPERTWKRTRIARVMRKCGKYIYVQYVQKAQLSQRDCALLCVIEYFAKSLKVIQNDNGE